MKVIEKLTKEQEKQIPKYIEKFVKLAEKPTDRKAATEAVQNLYKSAGEQKPIVIFAESPFAAAIMVAICREMSKGKLAVEDSQLGSQLDSQLYSQLYSQLDSQLGSQLDSQLGSQLGSQLRSQLYSQLRSQLYSQLHLQLDSQLYSQLRSQLYSQLHLQLDSQLYSQLRSQLYSQLYSQLGSQLRSQLYSQLRSQLPKINNDWWLLIWWLVWAGWYAFAEYIGVKFDNKTLKLFMDFVTNVSFIIPYKGIAFVSETPKHIGWDNKLLHGEHEAAVEYKDGYSLYAYKGVRVNEKIIKTPEKLTKKDWLDEENLEVRRIIQEVMGDKFPKKIGAKLIKRPSKEFRQQHNLLGLYEVKLPDDPEKIARYIKVQDHSSKRQYYLRVKPDMTDADEALAWTFGMSKEEYQPIQEA